jgi:ethanolaminephosphotransferase
MVMANFFMIAYYDWDYLTTSNDLGIKRDPIPSIIWFVCGVLHLVAHTLDGIDGKQARRTGSSTPLGKWVVSVSNFTIGYVLQKYWGLVSSNLFTMQLEPSLYSLPS